MSAGAWAAITATATITGSLGLQAFALWLLFDADRGGVELSPTTIGSVGTVLVGVSGYLTRIALKTTRGPSESLIAKIRRET